MLPVSWQRLCGGSGRWFNIETGRSTGRIDVAVVVAAVVVVADTLVVAALVGGDGAASASVF